MRDDAAVPNMMPPFRRAASPPSPPPFPSTTIGQMIDAALAELCRGLRMLPQHCRAEVAAAAAREVLATMRPRPPSDDRAPTAIPPLPQQQMVSSTPLPD